MSGTSLSPEWQRLQECLVCRSNADDRSATAPNSAVSNCSTTTLIMAEREMPVHIDVAQNALSDRTQKGVAHGLLPDAQPLR